MNPEQSDFETCEPPAFQHQTLETFHDGFDSALKSRIVDLSKLLCEVWLGEERGLKFKEAMLTKSVKEALTDCQIEFPEKFVDFVLDTSSFNGSLEVQENLHQGLTFLWKLPYAPWPQSALDKDEINKWISTCDDWLKQDHDQTLPCPTNIYIPLATM